MPHYDENSRGPLDGVRILDLSRLVAGNMVTHVLADHGADVIKVEHQQKGDDLRSWRVEGVAQSPITGPEGNVEFLLAAQRG